MSKCLTPKQAVFLDTLRDLVTEHQEWPLQKAIMDRMGYKSPNSVTQNLQALVKKGYLKGGGGEYRFVQAPCPLCGSQQMRRAA